jgi:hypothetical protein
VTRTPYRLLVCVDCYMCAAGADDDDAPREDPQPLSRIPEGDDVTPGWADDMEDPDDDYGFSWARCDGCGSTLGGDRFKVTGWSE